MKNVDQLSNSYICMNFLMDSFLFFFSLFLYLFNEHFIAAKINWTLIISIIVIIMSYRMWATGTGKIIREDIFGWSTNVDGSGMEDVVDPVMPSEL